MAPFLIPIVSMLADKGLDLLSGAIEGGAEKAAEFVGEKTGIDITTKKSLSAEDVAKLKKLELEEANRLAEFALREKALDNENTKNAREMNVKLQESENASKLAKDSAYYIDFAVIGGTLLMGAMLFFVTLPQQNLQIANIMFGALLGYVGTIVNYNRGSSSSSKDKDAKIHELAKFKK